jgi:hypothetical protein
MGVAYIDVKAGANTKPDYRVSSGEKQGAGVPGSRS